MIVEQREFLESGICRCKKIIEKKRTEKNSIRAEEGRETYDITADEVFCCCRRVGFHQ